MTKLSYCSSDTDYTLDYANNVDAGTATATISGLGRYVGEVQATFAIGKAANKITLKKQKASYRVSALKKKAKTFAIGAKAATKVTYTRSKAAKKAGVKVSSAGKVTVKKGTKKGTYTITVKAAGTKNYAAAKAKTVTITVRK